MDFGYYNYSVAPAHFTFFTLMINGEQPESRSRNAGKTNILEFFPKWNSNSVNTVMANITVTEFSEFGENIYGKLKYGPSMDHVHFSSRSSFLLEFQFHIRVYK